MTETKPKAETIKAENRPFRVIHSPTGDVVKGFDNLESAREDAVERNGRAGAWGLKARYEAKAKPK